MKPADTILKQLREAESRQSQRLPIGPTSTGFAASGTLMARVCSDVAVVKEKV